MALSDEAMQEEARHRLKVYPALVKSLRALAHDPEKPAHYAAAFEALALADMELCPHCRQVRVAKQTAMIGMGCQACIDAGIAGRA